MTETTAGSRRSGEVRSADIVRAARALIVEKGFEGLRTRDIADRAGINIATLHYHVPSKDALVELVARSILQDFVDQSARRPRQGVSPLRHLRMEFEDFEETMTDMPDLVVIYSELLDRARRDRKVQDIMRPLHTAWLDVFKRIFHNGVADGTFRADLDPAAAAAITTGALVNFWRRDPAELPPFAVLITELERSFLAPAQLGADLYRKDIHP
ncbi:MAG TPA: TetR/AcrR family transcriptional regulator [Devosiaceae bacterium]|jgi:AcrR family transcriptional regulator